MLFRNSLILGQNVVVKRFKPNTFPPIPIFRYFSSEDSRNKYIPTLMYLPMHPHPNLILKFKNFMFSVLISSYFDLHFSRQNFLERSKQAVEFVSNCLANEDFQTLEDSNCVTPECLTILKLKLLNFTNPQKAQC